MKALYIHGLDSYPVPDKLEILDQAGLDVSALHLNYRTENNSYRILKSHAQKHNIEFIVGSSLGGYLGYWLGEELGLPCLLFNPAMSYSDILAEYMPEITHLNCPARFVVIGRWDDTVDPEENIRFFRKAKHDNCRQRIVVCEWLSHQIDFVTFEEMVNWALTAYRLYRQQVD